MTLTKARAPLSASLRSALWFGLALGVTEVLALGVKKVLLGGTIHVSPQFVWMAPTGNVVLFLAMAFVVHAIARVVPRVNAYATCIVLFVFLSTVALLALPRVLAPWAVVAVALGVAVQSAVRHIGARARFQRIIRVSTVLLAGLVLLFAGLLNGYAWFRERSAVARRPEPSAGTPNIVMIVWDTVRAASLGLYGFTVPTPNLDRLAEQGVTFEAALATTSWTLPSHASLFTGHVPNNLSATWFDPLDDQHPVLAEVASARGYRTGGFVSNLLYTSREHGLARGFTHYEDYRVSIGQLALSTTLGRIALQASVPDWYVGPVQRLLGKEFLPGRKTAPMVNESFLRWLDEEPSAPFFAFLNYFDAHQPYDPPARFRQQFAPSDAADPLATRLKDFWRLSPDARPPAEQIQSMLASYEASIAWLDEQLGVLIDQLDRRGKLDNTILLITSDHGEEFNEHGQIGHGTNLYFWQLHVPLVLVAPGRAPAGVRVSEPVSLQDVPATIAQWLPGSEPPDFPGQSLERAWSGDHVGSYERLPPVAELSPGRNRARVMRSIASDGLYYVRGIDRSEELYDLANDPFQEHPITAGDSLTVRLGRLLEQRISCPPGACRPAGESSR
ncbi:MAG: sulfatase [Longimicrobiales bacterium]